MTLLEVEGLSKHFGGVTAVNGCSLSLQPGSITGLIGPNGSGKTTVFNLITGFIARDCRRGALQRAVDRRISVRTGSTRLGIGRTFQLARIFPRSPRSRTCWCRCGAPGFAACSRAGSGRTSAPERWTCSTFMDISHVAGLLGGSLSYGQRKLLELAAVMMAQPQLVLLDEPAGGVNPALLERIAEHIRQLNEQGVAFLLVEHNMPFVMGLCQEVVVLHRGAVIASGTPGRGARQRRRARRVPGRLR